MIEVPADSRSKISEEELEQNLDPKAGRNEKSSSSEVSSGMLCLALGFFLGGFALLNVLANFASPVFDANLWWIDLRSFPHSLATTFLLLSAVCLIASACGHLVQSG